jgi:Ca2+:H+ antiporter
VTTIPVAVVLLLIYVAVTSRSLLRAKRLHDESGAIVTGAWSLPVSLAALAATTVLTALISETLVHSLHAFAESAGLSEFFIAAVIVAIVGNAAEHGGAIVIASRGKLPLATEIAVSSSAQVALLVTPAVALLSWIVRPALPLTFRPIELAAMGGAAVLVAVTLADGRGRRWEGFMLVAVYVGVALGFLAAGDR